MPARRGDRASIGFMIVWLVVWAAGMLIAVWSLGAAALRGEGGAILFLAIWLGGACIGLVAGARKLGRLTFGGPPAAPPPVPRTWNDGIEQRIRDREPR